MSSRTGSWLIISYIHDISKIKKLDPISISPVDRRRRLLIFPWLDFQLDYSALYSIDWFNSDWFFTWGPRFLTLCVSQLETLTMAAIRVTRTIFFCFVVVYLSSFSASVIPPTSLSFSVHAFLAIVSPPSPKQQGFVFFVVVCFCVCLFILFFRSFIPSLSFSKSLHLTILLSGNKIPF